jgi:PAT family beta-lactamase induction signal transducer AmpG
MSLCNLRFTASQYALLSAVAASGRVFLGPVAGVMVAAFGWTQFFIWAFILSFPGLFFLMLLKQRVLAYATVN